jgi:hypothetical protein
MKNRKTIRQAHSLHTYRCDDPKCGRVHVELCNKHGKAFAEFVVDDVVLQLLTDSLRIPMHHPIPVIRPRLV